MVAKQIIMTSTVLSAFAERNCMFLHTRKTMQIASRAQDIVVFRMGDLLEAKLVTQGLRVRVRV
jgi:hypothetical protein